MQPVPRMDERVLRQVVRQFVVAGKSSKEGSYLRLVSLHQLAKGARIGLRDRPGDEILVVGTGIASFAFQTDGFWSLNREMMR